MKEGVRMRLLCLVLALLLIPLPSLAQDSVDVILENNEEIRFQQQHYVVERGGDLTITVGVPLDCRLASVSYEQYTVSDQATETDGLKQVTLTLHRVRYPVLLRFTLSRDDFFRIHTDGGEEIIGTDSPRLRINTPGYDPSLERPGYAVIGWTDAAGQYRFYGKVHHKGGKVWGKKSGEQFPFDPGVLTDDDGRVWLYSGFATKVPFPASRWHDLKNDGGVVMELEPDMVTIKTEPKVLFPTKGKPGAFPGHAFFEASSIRKVEGKYCFVCCTIPLSAEQSEILPLNLEKGVYPLYFRYRGEGAVDFISFTFHTGE